MKYMTIAEAAKKFNLTERSVRNYCANKRIPGAVLDGKTWKISCVTTSSRNFRLAGHWNWN